MRLPHPVRALAATLILGVLAYVAVGLLGASSPAPLSYVSDPVEAPAAVPAAETAPVEASAAPVSGVPATDEAWVARTASEAGIPVPAMRAYARAELGRPQGCALGWTTLAGIGWVESQHGTLGGRTLAEDGKSSTPIVGPALSGGLDHAYGPMQFIPSTWARWASDGDGDGLADIDDIDDAAMTAMRYLCGTGQDLTSGTGWSQAVFAYNHSQVYVEEVRAAADRYAERTR